MRVWGTMRPTVGTRESLVRRYGGCLRAPAAHRNGDGRSSLLAMAKGEVIPSQAVESPETQRKPPATNTNT